MYPIQAPTTLLHFHLKTQSLHFDAFLSIVHTETAENPDGRAAHVCDPFLRERPHKKRSC